MPELGTALMFLGWIIATAGGVGCFIAVYRQSEEWAFWSYFLQVIILVAIFKYWRATRKPFLIMLLGLGMWVIGLSLGGSW